MNQPILARLLSRVTVLVALALSLSTASATIVITGGGLALVQEAGTFDANNLAAGKVAFAKDVFPSAPHAIAKVNDGVYGNAASWIAGSTNSFIGINLGATPVLLRSVAFGRDNQGVQNSRWIGVYTLQYTTVPNPDATTPDASWVTIGTLDYQSAGGTLFTSPTLRHRFVFDPVSATGFRLITVAGGPSFFEIGVDELELYAPSGLALNGGGLVLMEEGGSIRPGNLAAGKTPFAKDVLPVAPHTIAGLNDQTFGNSSSWIGGSGSNSFAGINLGATPVAVYSIAFGRDNTSGFTDRCLGLYTLQYTTTPNPDANTTAWTTIGTLNYISAGGTTPGITNFASPALRHRYVFTPVEATGIRLVAASDDTAIDELELYGFSPAAAVVTTGADSGPGSLRQAILDSAEVPGPTTLSFAPELNGATIALLSPLTVSVPAGVSNSVIVDATALASGLTLNGGGTNRLIQAVSGRGLTLRGLTLTNGLAPTGEGGGAINSANSVVTLWRCVLAGNSAGAGAVGADGSNGGPGGAGGSGGAIQNFLGTLTVTDCTFSGNAAGSGGRGGFGGNPFGGIAGQGGAGGSGGAIFNFGGTVALTNCTLSGNRSGDGGVQGGPQNVNGANAGYGGAIYGNGGTLTLTQCTLNSNRTGNGGDSFLHNEFVTTVGGFGGDGGAVYATANTLTLTHCTIVGNQVGTGGRNGNGSFRSNGTGGGVFVNHGTPANVANSIVAANSGAGAGDVFSFGTLTRAGVNLIQQFLAAAGTESGPAALTNAPLLAPLGTYGGFTQTMPPLSGSPAVDAGDDFTTNSLVTDSRGAARLVGSHVDLGAAELTPLAITLPSTGLTLTSVALNGTVYPGGVPTIYYFQYGTTTNYDQTTATGIASGSTTFPVTIPITGLPLSTLHHFRLVASNGFGLTPGADVTFTSGTIPPTFTTLNALAVGTNAINGSRSVRLTAGVNPNQNSGLITLYFQFGLTPAYGGSVGPISVPASMDTTNVAVVVDHFSAGHAYHWNVTATNAGGGTITTDQTFTLGAGRAGDTDGDGIVSQGEFDAVYANYVVNSPWLYLTNTAGLGSTNVSFELGNSSVGSYSVQYTTNLVDWLPLGTATPRYLFTDTNAPALPQRYYRLTYP